LFDVINDDVVDAAADAALGAALDAAADATLKGAVGVATPRIDASALPLWSFTLEQKRRSFHFYRHRADV